MKNKLIYLLAFLLSFLTCNLFAQGALEVRVSKIRDTKGTIRVGLFNSEETFLKDPVLGQVVKATGKEVVVSFENLKPGEYGITVMHDENENGELDMNSIGIPKEGFAFGNNSMGMFGAPSFKKARVVIEDKAKVTQEINLKYL